MNEYIFSSDGHKLYKSLCSECGSSRGYQRKNKVFSTCRSCTAKKTIKKYGNPMQGKKHKDRARFRNNTYDNVDYDDVKIEFTKNNNKIIKYKQKCPNCNSEIGYRKQIDALRTCKKCQDDKRRKYTPEQYRLRSAIKSNVSSRLRARNSGKNYTSTFSMLDFTFEELVAHLESQFQEGMTWDNYGLHGWHIDHIKPDSLFKYNSYNDIGFKKCWALSNLQPLWAIDNLRKSNKWEGE